MYELGHCMLDQVGDNGALNEFYNTLYSHHPPITACYMWDDEHGIRVSLKSSKSKFLGLIVL